jgi:predicted nicotinamide N-methyase
MSTFMTLEEMNAEVIECARYGEPEELRAFLAAGADVNSKDITGSTALHKAAANGEIECLAILKEYNASYLANDGGNYPSHWAAQNAKLDAMKFLVENYNEVDMLTKNSQGRSTLTDAFTRGDEGVLEVCLSHDSASEEELIRTQNSPRAPSPGQTPDDIAASREATNTEGTSNAILHTMSLLPGSGNVVKIRELPITRADNPFGTDVAPEDDTTGLALWPATVLCARWVASQPDLTRNKVVVELGAGCGLPGLAAAVYGAPKSVYITDIHDPTLQNAIYNTHLNAIQTSVENNNGSTQVDTRSNVAFLGPDASVKTVVQNVSWTDPSTYPEEKAHVLLGSDLVYDASILAVLCPAVHAILQDGGTFLYVAPDDGRDGMAGLITALQECGIELVSQTPCPDHLYSNPLARLSKAAAASGTDTSDTERSRSEPHSEDVDTSDHFVLHFYDVARKQAHTLYRFDKAVPGAAAARADAGVARTASG